MMNLYEVKDKKVKIYSQGMKQRLGIGMTLIGEPDVLFLDEPLNGVDPHGIAEFREIIKSVNKIGITMVISSHILMELYKVATNLIFLKKGKMVKELSIEEIEELQVDRYILNTENNEKAKENIENIINTEVSLTEEGNILINKNEEIVLEVIEHLRTSGIRTKEYYKYRFDLEAYYKENI